MLTILDAISSLDETLFPNCLRHRMSLLINRQIFPFAFFTFRVALHLFTLMFPSFVQMRSRTCCHNTNGLYWLVFLFLLSFCLSPMSLAPLPTHSLPNPMTAPRTGLESRFSIHLIHIVLRIRNRRKRYSQLLRQLTPQNRHDRADLPRSFDL